MRCFLNELVRAHDELREIPMRLDTSWVDMDAETLVLVWRGNVAIRSEKLIGISHFLAPPSRWPRRLADVKQFWRLLEEALARREMEDEELEAEDEPDAEEPEQDEEPEDESAPAPQSAIVEVRRATPVTPRIPSGGARFAGRRRSSISLDEGAEAGPPDEARAHSGTSAWKWLANTRASPAAT